MTAQRVVPGVDGSRFSSIVHVEETGSTNADLLEAARAGEAEGAVRVTDHQTAGRGRQARAWHDDPGNAMLMSVLVRPPSIVVPVVPFIAGLAVTDGASVVIASTDPTSAGRTDLALKWPNDVLVPRLDERKLSGILAEAITAPALAVVVGMGLNLRWGTPPPPEIASRAATLEEIVGGPVDRWNVVRAVLTALERWLTVAEDGGVDQVLDEYRQRCCTLGRAVRLERPADVIEGTASAIADDGALIVETADGAIPVTAGDAHHLA